MEDYQTTEHVKEEVVDRGFVEIEDHQSTTEHVKEEVLDTEFVAVDSQDVHQLCTACLCATRTTRTLDDDVLKQYYMHILTEMQPEGGVVVLQSPRVCWECVSHLKRSVRFREQVQDSYRLLQPMLSMCDQEDLAECLQTSVSRPERLKAYFPFSIDIAPQDDDAQVMTVTKHDDGHDAASESLDTNIEIVLSSIKTTSTPYSTLQSTGDVNTTFVCDYCYERFTSKATLERHIATYNIYPHNNKAVQSPCEDCAVVLCSDDQCSECSNKHNLLQQSNMKTIIMKVPYQCKVCLKSFSLKSSLLRHTRAQHTGEKRHLLKHLRVHTGGKPYQCEVCHKSFSQKDSLVKHIRTHTGEKPYQCEVCRKSFTRTSHLRDHLRTHTGEKPYQCEVCHKYYSSKPHLLRHLRVHTGGKPYQCEVCNKSFSEKGTLVYHIRTHTGEKPYQCKVCHKSFSQKPHLLRHMRIHTGEKPYQCELCHKSFSQKPHLLQHMGIHTGEKPYQCELCHKSFTHKPTLIIHLRVHTGEKLYQCEVCHKSFSQKHHLLRHLTVHTGEKPYMCVVCHKSFSRNDSLVKHIRKHTAEKFNLC